MFNRFNLKFVVTVKSQEHLVWNAPARLWIQKLFPYKHHLMHFHHFPSLYKFLPNFTPKTAAWFCIFNNILLNFLWHLAIINKLCSILGFTASYLIFLKCKTVNIIQKFILQLALLCLTSSRILRKKKKISRGLKVTQNSRPALNVWSNLKEFIGGHNTATFTDYLSLFNSVLLHHFYGTEQG